jgi:HEPN domain-containing protein
VADVPSVAVGPAAFRVFLKKSREFARGMDAALAGGDFNAAASAASHCVISAADALLARHKRIRSKARDHAAVIRLVETTGVDGVRERADRVERVLALKQVAEYDDRDVRRAEAEDAVKRARRFLEWVESQVGK